MGGIREGIEEINQYNEARRKQFSGESQQYLRLKADGDEARIRILSKTAVSADFHEVFDQESKWLNVIYCPRTRKADEPEIPVEECEFCSKNDRPAHMFLLWVYVYDRCHKYPPPEGQDWEKIQRGGVYLYKEKVNRIMILRQKTGRNNSTYEQFVSNYLNHDGTFNDRNYIFRRSGVKLDTTYSLTSLDKSDMTDEVKKAIEDMGGLPSLGDIILGKFEPPEATELSEEGVPAESAEEGTPVNDSEEGTPVKTQEDEAGKAAEEAAASLDNDDLPF